MPGAKALQYFHLGILRILRRRAALHYGRGGEGGHGAPELVSTCVKILKESEWIRQFESMRLSGNQEPDSEGKKLSQKLSRDFSPDFSRDFSRA